MTDTNPELLRAVERLRAAMDAVRLPLDLPEVDQARQARTALLQQFDDYVLPRLRSLDAPLLCVVGGSTGAGKSTLVNSAVGQVVSRAGVLRPTTRASVLVHHPQDEAWFTNARILPGLARVTGEAQGGEDPNSVQMVTSTALPPGLALLDAPDIDSVVQNNRTLSRQLLSAADLWLFVTTASRYADAVPWELLRQASERGTAVAVVLNRVPPEAMEEVRLHLSQMLREQNLDKSPIFTIPEADLDDELRIAEKYTARLTGWLHSLAGDARARSVVIRRTLAGALASLADRTAEVTAAADRQVEAQDHLRALAQDAYRDAQRGIEAGVADGSLLRGEVLARWQELVGTGEFLRQIEVGIARVRDRVTSFFTGKQISAEPLGEALQSGVAALVTSHTQVASSTAARSWKTTPGGPALIENHPELLRAAPQLAERTERMIRDWQSEILELVRNEAGKRRTTARYLAFGVNGLAVMLMLLVFSATGGALLGGEVAIAGGSAVLAQRLLEAVFGDQAVRDMAKKARQALLERTEELLLSERVRFDEVIDEVPLTRGAVDSVRSAAVDVEGAR